MYRIDKIVLQLPTTVVLSGYFLSLIFGSGLHIHKTEVHEGNGTAIVLHAHESEQSPRHGKAEAFSNLHGKNHSHFVAKVLLVATPARVQPIESKSVSPISLDVITSQAMRTSLTSCSEKLALSGPAPPLLAGTDPLLSGRSPPIA